MLRHAVRSLVRTPIISLLVVLCIGLGAGAATTVFAWTEHLVRKPLPAVEAPERLVSVIGMRRGREESVSYPDYRDWREHSSKLQSLAAFGIRQVGVRSADEARDASRPGWALFITGNYFDVLGIKPSVGRLFVPGETATEGQAAVLVASHAFARRLGGAAGAVGRQLRVNDITFTVIGVAPPEFSGTYAGLAFDLWIPVTMQPLVTGEADALDERGFRWLQTVGRLDQSTSLAEAQRELQAIGRRLAGMYQENGEYQAYVKPLDTGVARRLAALFTVLLGMTGLVSLIVCSNVANLLMLRGSTRASELGIRLSLGASRGRLALQLFLESTILAALGTAVGLVVARWGQDLLPAMMPASTLPLSLQGKWSVAMALFGVAFGLGMMVLFGVGPAIHSVRSAALPHAAQSRGWTTRRATRVRAALVIAQLAFSMAALAAAGAFLRANAELASMDRGLTDPEQVFLVSTQLDQAGYRTEEQRTAVTDRLLAEIRAVPGVDSAAFATFVPLGFGGYSSVIVQVPGYVPSPDEAMAVLVNRVSPGYFEAAGVAIRDGRPIDERDTSASARIAVVNEAFVRRYLTSGSPLGEQIDIESGRVSIVGVARDGKYRFDALDEAAPPHIYLPYRQHARAGVTLHVRMAHGNRDMLPLVRRQFGAINPALPLLNPTTLEDYTSLPLLPVRLGTTVLGWLGGVALILAATGLYGVLAFRVSQRRQELAVRLALGATQLDVLRLVVGDGLRQAFCGIGIGALLGIAATRLISARLPRVTLDPGVLLASAVALTATALLASLLPALHATSVDPAGALKRE